MIASLPMYDFPYIREATDGFWTLLAKELGVQGGLARGEGFRAVWEVPDLVFSQTCGYPLTHDLRGKAKYVATPHYSADGCEGPLYRSIVFAREGRGLSALKGSVGAVNTPESMSGMLALKAAVLPYTDKGRFFGAVKWTGSHANSLKALQDGEADICAIDCVTVAHLRRAMPELLKGLHEIARTPMMPGLPFITNADVDGVRSALKRVFDDPATAATRKAMLMEDFSVLPVEAYDAITELEEGITRAGGVLL